MMRGNRKNPRTRAGKRPWNSDMKQYTNRRLRRKKNLALHGNTYRKLDSDWNYY